MKSDRFTKLIQTLWPKGETTDTPQVYAILDGARDAKIEPLVRLGRRDYECLYSGKLAPRLQAAAPYLVHLSREGKLTRDLLESGWGQSWGLYAIAPNDSGLQQLRRHFRDFLRVQDEEGKKLVFRYYDPRVLRVYLPTCTPEETKRFFGPVIRYVLEGPSGQSLLEFSRDPAGGLKLTETVT
jgi:hypothetical protein